MKKKLIPLVLALVLILLPTMPASAATSQDVTVTGQPGFISISNAPATWVINSLTGNSIINVDTWYYANPVGDTTEPNVTVADGDCNFTITNTSTIPVDLTVTMANFTGGDAMANSDVGTNEAAKYGACSYFSGDTWSSGNVTIKVSGSSVGKNALAALTNIKWGVALETQINAWTTGDNMTSTLTITATAD